MHARISRETPGQEALSLTLKVRFCEVPLETTRFVQTPAREP
jgi:hypothetical protein